ncbi:MAG: hypothetical protein OES21_06500, partial [Myxococcales bacterium]|nr:hypothetical protein [Myxococcales bacterium]
MVPARPQLPSQPCPACGRGVDPLRSARVLWLEDRVRFLCDTECSARFLQGERDFDFPTRRPAERPRVERPSIPDLVREATVVRDESDASNAEGSHARLYDPAIATGLAFLALALLLLTPNREVGWLGAFLVVLCAAVNARIPLTTLRGTESLRVVAPLGLALAAIASLLTTGPEAQRWSLVGAAVAAIAVSVRNWVHASLFSSLHAAARELRETLPLKARVPSPDRLAYEEVPAADLRQGDLAVVLEGELAPADGMLEEGSGLGLRYPKAAHTRPYDEGDFILAGTRMLEGAATIRVRRTGDDRGIVRAIELGRRK